MKSDFNNPARALPAVEAVLKLQEAARLIEAHGRSAVVQSVRNALAELRLSIRKSSRADSVLCPAQAVLERAAAQIAASAEPRLKRAINATGIILHTGLGRAVMPEAAAEQLGRLAGYCNLQQDMQSGKRGRREECLREITSKLTGAEDVLVVNNNAGATFLLLTALARGREVVISRGELIEIGGSFRLPDIMEAGGVIIREIGTTNKTHLRDYERAMGPQTALVLKAHRSNYKIIGFAEEAGIGAIAQIAAKRRVPVVDDLGCGALIGLERFGLPHECTVRESLRAGSALALFSTDKLIGGPQGGMIVGRSALIERIRSHPLYRILRVCKLTLGALEATLRLFLEPELLAKKHPLYAMMAKSPDEMKAQALELEKSIQANYPAWEVAAAEDVSYLGGGSLPEDKMPSFSLRLRAPRLSADGLARGLRSAPVPVVPRVAGGRVILDMRTVARQDLPDILRALGHATKATECQA
ncbi:MAG: L-seryl-tRNA(Sec) selenium transferase [Kiritimatiellia bacterium]